MRSCRFQELIELMEAHSGDCENGFSETLSWNFRAHGVKFGADWHGMRNVWRDIPATREAVDFNGQFTCARGRDGVCLAHTGLSYGDFLLGQVQEASLSNLFVETGCSPPLALDASILPCCGRVFPAPTTRIAGVYWSPEEIVPSSTSV
jgi:hypothetical protein